MVEKPKSWRERSWRQILPEAAFLIFNLIFLLVAIKQALWADPFGGLHLPLFGGEAKTTASQQRMNILFLGIDSVEGTHRTDTLLLAGIDLPSKSIHIVSIPRDTRVLIDGKGHKINEVFARHGIENLRALIEDLMDIRINRFVRIDFQGFISVMDSIGGIDINIEHPMNYDDNEQKLHIHFTTGPQHLDGKKALEYVRFRADASADLGRIKRQQRFVAAVLEKLSSPAIMLKIPEILGETFKFIQTDLNPKEAIEVAYNLKGQGFKIETESLPGEAKYIDKGSYYVAFKDQAVALGAKWFSNLSTLNLEASFTSGIGSATNLPDHMMKGLASPTMGQATSVPSIAIGSSPIPVSLIGPKTASLSSTVAASSPFSPSASPASPLPAPSPPSFFASPSSPLPVSSPSSMLPLPSSTRPTSSSNDRLKASSTTATSAATLATFSANQGMKLATSVSDLTTPAPVFPKVASATIAPPAPASIP